MRSKKIICVIEDVWDDKLSTLGFDAFLEQGYDVEIWKTGKIISNRSVWVACDYNIASITFKTWRQLYKKIISQSFLSPIYLFYTYGVNQYDKAQALIKCLGGKYCTISYSPLGSKYNHIRLKEILARKHHYMDLFPASYNFLGAYIHACGLRSRHEVEKGNNIFLHTHDYDIYLENEKSGETIKGGYILFYDQNLLDHKDQVNFGIKKFVPNEERYISELNYFLDLVEETFQKEIIIAAHPTASQSISRIYGKRKVVYGNSCNYTKYADFVIAFSSGAVSYAVLYKKPILFWNCDQLKRTLLFPEWQAVKAAILKAKILNVSQKIKDVKLEDYLTDTQNYEPYRKYIVSGKEKRNFFEIVIDYINEL